MAEDNEHQPIEKYIENLSAEALNLLLEKVRRFQKANNKDPKCLETVLELLKLLSIGTDKVYMEAGEQSKWVR